jgi:hypothetical protein
LEIDQRHANSKTARAAHIAWVAAEYATEVALHEWRAASGGTAPDTFAAYVSALDHEERAANALARVVARDRSGLAFGRRH